MLFRSNDEIKLRVIIFSKQLIAYWADNSTPDYDNATDTQKRENAFFSDNDGFIDDNPGYGFY